jgi:hypothetical protein
VANEKEKGQCENLEVGGRIALRCRIDLAQNRRQPRTLVNTAIKFSAAVQLAASRDRLSSM